MHASLIAASAGLNAFMHYLRLHRRAKLLVTTAVSNCDQRKLLKSVLFTANLIDCV